MVYQTNTRPNDSVRSSSKAFPLLNTHWKPWFRCFFGPNWLILGGSLADQLAFEGGRGSSPWTQRWIFRKKQEKEKAKAEKAEKAKKEAEAAEAAAAEDVKDSTEWLGSIFSVEKSKDWRVTYGFVWKCCVPHCTQWFSWSLSHF